MRDSETLRPPLWGRPMAQLRQFAILAVACTLSDLACVSQLVEPALDHGRRDRRPAS